MHRIFLLLVFLVACGGGSRGGSAGPTDQRILGLHVNEAEDGDFDAAMDLARGAGVEEAHLSLNWNDIETAPQVYGNVFLAIANSYYPARGMKLNLTLRPINTVTREVPSDLESLDWDDPVMISRFQQMLAYLFSEIPDLTLGDVAVGNEVDGTLSGQAEYDAFRVFYEAARAHIRALRPLTRVGVTATFGGLTGSDRDLLLGLNQPTDFISVTYYPLNGDFTVRDPSEVASDFAALAALYPGRAIVFQECGYPSSPVCNSSEQRQADFVRAVFAAWDDHAEQIDKLFFEHQHDWSTATVDQFLVYYGVATPEFRGYLDSLGMRSHAGSGTDKLAWTAFEEEAAARGW